MDAAGYALVSMQEEWWSPEDLDRVCEEMGVPVTTIEQVLTPVEANRRFPGAASFFLVHRLALTSVALCVVILILLGVLGAVTGGNGGR
jgi:hypothetical protein